MGKGDRKTKRGKINMGSFGKHRPHKIKAQIAEKPEPEKGNKKAK